MMKGASYRGTDATTATVDVGGAKIPALGFGTYGMNRQSRANQN
jgi:hypothetical protein